MSKNSEELLRKDNEPTKFKGVTKDDIKTTVVEKPELKSVLETNDDIPEGVEVQDLGDSRGLEAGTKVVGLHLDEDDYERASTETES